MADKAKTKVNRYIFLALVAVVATLGLLYYFLIAVPDARASDYLNQTRAAAGPLESAFTELSKTTEQTMFYDPNIAVAEKYNQAINIKESSAKALAELNKFRVEADQPLGLGFGSKNGDATFLQARSHQVIAECQDILAEYAKVGDFLIAFYGFQADMQPMLAGSLSPTDPAEVAGTLRANAERVRRLSVPAEFNDIKAGFIGLINSVVAELESQQSGLESLQTANSDLNYDLFKLIAEDSYAVTNVEYLPDKLENIKL